MPTKSKTPAPVTADQSVSDCLTTICQHNFDYLVQWQSTARNWDDIEGVHQIRVSFRRMRSALSVFRSAVPKSSSRFWADELRWLASELGPARDLDVFIDEGLDVIRGILPLAGEDKIRALAESHRADAYKRANAMLDSDRYHNFKHEFPRWIRLQPWRDGELSGKHEKNLNLPLITYARRLLDGQEQAVLLAGSEAHRDDAAEMHRLRIECKKLRYAAEFFQPLFAGMDEFIAHLKSLQDLLGVMNDVSVLKGLLSGLLEDVTDVETRQYGGGLVGWRTREFYQMRDSFDERWEHFLHARHPWWTPLSGH
jgi:CHAD domain-containing protein